MSSILVIGSTGNVGRALVDELSAAGRSVRAATRNPSAYRGPSNAHAVRFDYGDPDSFEPALEGVDRLFMIGPPEPEPDAAMTRFLKVAATQGRKVVLMTAMGTEADDAGPLRGVELTLERSGSPFVLLRPNWFMDNFHTTWLPPIQEGGVIPLPAADAATSLIDSRDIAASAAAALTSDRFDGKAFTLTGPEALTYEAAAAILSAVSGRAIQYLPLDDAAFIASLVEAGVPEDLAGFLAALFEAVRAGATAEVASGVEDLTGRPARSLETYARDHASAWS